jgi:hypothetical protein
MAVKKKLDNELVARMLLLQGKRVQLSAAEGHEVLKCMRLAIAKALDEEPEKGADLLVNFVAGIKTKRTKLHFLKGE